MPEIRLSQGTIHYRQEGDGPPVLLIHGVLVNGTLWDRVLPLLSAHARCIVPDLPLGSHGQAMSDGADLSPPGLAALIVELIERLELQEVTLVGNDTGGALCQLLTAARPELVGRLVLTNCDAFEHFPPARFAPLIKVMARIPASITALALLARLGFIRRSAMAAASLTVDPIPDALIREWVSPLRSPAVRRDLVKVMRGISPQHTLNAAEQLRSFKRPVLLVWGTHDPVFFPLADAERLRDLFADARLEKLESARTFVPLDAAERLAELVGAFLTVPGTASA